MNITQPDGTTVPANLALTSLCLIGLSHGLTAVALVSMKHNSDIPSDLTNISADISDNC